MSIQKSSKFLMAAGSFGLAACGGGGGGEQLASLPPPPPVAPPPPAATPLPPAHIGLMSDKPFSVLGMGDTYSTDADGNHPVQGSSPALQDVQFSYNSATDSYQISLPGFKTGTVVTASYNGVVGEPASGSFNHVTAGSSGTLQPIDLTLPVPGTTSSPYTYTSLAYWEGQTGVATNGQFNHSEGAFVYGIPTEPGDMPITGSAGYSATILASAGHDTWTYIGGDVSLLFNFAAGTLSGWMHPQIQDGWDGIFVDYGQFDFKNTVYSTGSTTFSGQFVVPGLPNANSSFNGNFTGPGAAEIMARFETPYLLNGQQGTIAGVWIGKKN